MWILDHPLPKVPLAAVEYVGDITPPEDSTLAGSTVETGRAEGWRRAVPRGPKPLTAVPA